MADRKGCWAALAALVAVLAWAPPMGVASAAAQAAPAPSAVPNGETFLRLAHSSAAFQARAAEIAASRDARPEVRSFAQRMVEFRRDQIAKLLAIARQHMIAVSEAPEFEHRVILENLEPLDFLALSRRYAEIQQQALEQEAQGYLAAESSPDDWIRTLARETSPVLQRWLDEARTLRQTVGP